VFVYRGWAMRNHNKLLGRVQGLDGIKTGYTRNSGFNLVTSVRRGPRYIVAVVLGGTSGAARDARMRALIEQQIASGSTQRTIAKNAEAAEVAAAAAQPKPTIQPPSMARLARADAMAPITTNSVAEGDAGPAPIAQATHAAPPVASSLSPHPKPGSAEPINPVKVKTISVKAGNIQTAMVVPISPAPTATVAPPHFAKNAPTAVPAAPALIERPAVPAIYHVASANSAPVATGSATPRHPHPRGPWIIQVGAFPKEAEAQDRLREAQWLAKGMLAKADPFTERVLKGSQELYRARFAGFDQGGAEAACKYFKRNEIACMAIKN
jgi:D-alanyl-D-alanine carboxypeptidase